ncbi:MAG: ABC transporter permease [Desulfobacteraceae bacterium]|nr:ABC transporter permease [Desulfobacteraceae bacterium]
MKQHIKRTVKDILTHRFLNAVTIVTFAFAVLIVGAFGLFFINANHTMDTWKKGIRMLVYLKPGTSEAARLDAKFRLQDIAGVKEAVFVSKTEALTNLRELMKNRASLLDNLRENPLPDAFEITIDPSVRPESGMSSLAERITALSSVEEVEYGQKWVERFTGFVNLFKFTGYGLGCLFFIATVFIVANTIRLVLYSRREEIEIMRLVGATDRFIKEPFYYQGLIQGALGSAVGLLVLFFIYLSMVNQVDKGFASDLISLRFFDIGVILEIVLIGMVVGWIGSFVSLKQFFR